jgi:hypothetical protein
VISGSVFKKCGCRGPVLDAQGLPVLDAGGRPKLRRLGAGCPKLHRGQGWNPKHGTWHFQIEAGAPAADRHVVSRGGLSTRAEAESQMADVGRLLGLAEDLSENPAETAELRAEIVERIRRSFADRTPLPEYETVRRAGLAGTPVNKDLTVGQWLATWLAGKSALAASTRRTYAGHIENYLVPHLGSIRLERSRVSHVQAMFSAIAKDADTIPAANQARHAAEETARKAWHGRDWAAWRAAKDELDAMPPLRPVCNAAARQKIRSTLRSALSAAQAQQLATINMAALAELECGPSPKALVWTPERVARWRATGEVPSTVMVWTAQQTNAFLERALPGAASGRGVRAALVGCGLGGQDGECDPADRAGRLGYRVHDTEVGGR